MGGAGLASREPTSTGTPWNIRDQKGWHPIGRLLGAAEFLSNRQNEFPNGHLLSGRRDGMKIHSFDESHQSGGDYKVGEGPAVGSGTGPGGGIPRAGTTAAPGDASETDPYSYLREEIDRTRRDQMKIDQDPTVQGVKTDKGKRRGGSGKSRGAKKGEGKGNYYEDKASGTGVHT